MPRTERLWVTGAVVIALLMALVGYFLLIGPQRARTAAVRDDVSSAAFQESTLQARIVSLTAQNKRIGAYRTALARARQALPASTDLAATPQLLRRLAAEAAATSTSITDLTVGDPIAATVAPAATPTLSSIVIGLTVTGSPARLTQFLGGIQLTQTRALLVTAVSLGAATGPGAATQSLKLTMSAFVRPARG